MMEWQIIDSGRKSAEQNMELDRKLLRSLTSSASPILHFYDWQKSAATYGYFLRPEQFFKREALSDHKVDLARRPTGGGVLFHGCDFTFSLLLPASYPAFSLNTLENYCFVHRWVQQALTHFVSENIELCGKEAASLEGFCMGQPVTYDLMMRGKKVGGGAQRKTKNGFLHQGSLALTLPSPTFLDEVLLDGREVAEAFSRSSCSFLPSTVSEQELQSAKDFLKKELQSILQFL